MLSEIEYQKYTKFQHRLSKSANEYIDRVRSNEPSRMVGTHARKNLVSWFPSTVMDKTISLESRTAEYAFIVIGSYRGWFYEIWDQPEPEKIIKTNKNGVKRPGPYTGDFLVLTESGPQIVEVKTKSEIDALLESNPNDWKQLENGDIDYIPASERFSEIGIGFKVFVYDVKHRYLVSNLSFLLRSRDGEGYSNDLVKKVNAALSKEFYWTLYDLKKELKIENYTPLIQMVDRGLIQANLDQDMLTQPENCIVARSKILLEKGRELFFANQIYQDGVLSEVSIMEVPTEREAQSALEKLEKIKLGDAGRSTRRYKKQVKAGKIQGLTDFQALVSREHLKGNRVSKLNSVVDDFLNDYLINTHAPSQGLTEYRSFIRYKAEAQEVHPQYDAVCRKTFSRRLSKISAEIIAMQRGGKRLANSVSEPTDPLHRNLKAQVAWERAAIDHYLADIYLIYFSTSGEVYIQKPWLTAMIDLHSSVVLAISMSFLSPSRRSVAKVVRECVRKHGRLPAEIIVDRGSDFRSVYYASLLAHYSIMHTLRPASHPRFGGEVEGLFGEFKKQWLTQREGNVTDYKEARSVDGDKAPQKSAVLTPKDFYREITAFCEWRNNKCRGTSEVSAGLKFKTSQNNFPFVAKNIKYDAEFMLATSVETKKYTVDFSRGIRIGGFWYYSPEIKKVRGRKSKLDVRIDPENPHVIYALVDNQWCPCYSAEINTFSSKNHVDQLVEGLTKYEVLKLRSRIREQDDIELVKILKEMSGVKENQGFYPVLEMEEAPNGEENPQLSEILKFAEVKPYKREGWG